MNFLNTGARHAPSDADRQQAAVNEAAEKSRAQWLNALLVDELRAWENIGDRDPEVIYSMSAMLTLAGFVHTHDKRDADTPDIRIIRGAISAAAQCAKSGCKVSENDARAFSSACARASEIIRGGSAPAIVHAAQSMRSLVGLTT
jgi:hypothetical protein